MDITLFPAYQQMNDYVSNYTDGNIDDSNRLRALNRAIEDVHRRLGLVCDETIFNFLYSQDNMFTQLPSDYDEPILLYYVNNNYNQGSQSGWKWNKYTTILQNSGIGSSYGLGYAMGTYGQKMFSSTQMNGTKQLIQLGPNVIQGNIINSFSTLNLLSGTGDATSLAVDNNVFVNGGGSVSFTINPALGHGYGGILTSGFGIMSVQQALMQNGINKVYSWLPTTNISAIELIMTSSTGNFYTFTATSQDSGAPFVNSTINAIWNRTQFPWSLVSITGSPNSQSITSYEIRYVEGPSFGSVAIPLFRINDLYTSYPDNMNLVYYTQYKGTSADGLTKKIILDSVSDLPTFMQFFPDFVNIIALRAAYILMPQLSGDKEFMAIYKKDYDEQMGDLGKTYPRKRIVNLGGTLLHRP